MNKERRLLKATGDHGPVTVEQLADVFATKPFRILSELIRRSEEKRETSTLQMHLALKGEVGGARPPGPTRRTGRADPARSAHLSAARRCEWEVLEKRRKARSHSHFRGISPSGVKWAGRGRPALPVGRRPATHRASATRTAFWAWRRFSACWKIVSAWSSRISSLISLPR